MKNLKSRFLPLAIVASCASALMASTVKADETSFKFPEDFASPEAFAFFGNIDATILKKTITDCFAEIDEQEATNYNDGKLKIINGERKNKGFSVNCTNTKWSVFDWNSYTVSDLSGKTKRIFTSSCLLNIKRNSFDLFNSSTGDLVVAYNSVSNGKTEINLIDLKKGLDDRYSLSTQDVLSLEQTNMGKFWKTTNVCPYTPTS